MVSLVAGRVSTVVLTELSVSDHPNSNNRGPTGARHLLAATCSDNEAISIRSVQAPGALEGTAALAAAVLPDPQRRALADALRHDTRALEAAFRQKPPAYVLSVRFLWS